jgi:hypothetical protein
VDLKTNKLLEVNLLEVNQPVENQQLLESKAKPLEEREEL